ncbi:MAG: primosomal protein N', partial [Gemmatimonadales bacterium]
MPKPVGSRLARVALPLPLSTPYTYAVPDSLADRVRPGARVVVPLRERELLGVVLEIEVPLPPPGAGGVIKPIIATPDPEPAVSEPLLRLVRWVADYYGAPFGLALR